MARQSAGMAGINLAPLEGGNTLFAAWDMFYWLFGARAERIEVTPEGVFLNGLIIDPLYDMNRILEDTSRSHHRIDLVPAHFWALGQAPEHPTSAEVSIFMSMWFGGSGEGGKKSTPDYVKQSANAYRARFEMPIRGKGRPKAIKLNPLEMDKIDQDVLKDIPVEGLEAFSAILAKTIASRGVQSVGIGG